MCNLSKGVWDKAMTKGVAQGVVQGMAQGMAQGVAKGIVTSIKNMVKNMGVSVEQAMAVLEIPEEEQKKYRELLEQQ